MARIELENRLGVSLRRLLFTGNSYSVEPPPVVPPNALVFWQAEDSGAVSYDAEATTPGASASASAPPTGPLSADPSLPASYPPSDLAVLTTPAPALATSPQATLAPGAPAHSAPAPTFEPPHDEQPPVLPTTQPLHTVTQPPAAMTPTAPSVTATTGTRRVTLAWEYSPSGRPTYRVQGVDHSLRVRLRERPDGALYVVSARQRNRRAARAPRRPSRRAVALGVIAALLAVAVVSATGLAIYAGTDQVPFLSALFHTTTPPPPRRPSKKASLLLTVSHKGVSIGEPVVLTATVDGHITTSGYHIDIVNKATNRIENAAPCAPMRPCRVTVTSASPTSIIYRAYVERSFLKEIQVASSYVRATWLPKNAPTTITLSANPAADSTHTVHALIGTPVSLTAHTNLTVSKTGYQITVVDASHDTTSLTGSPCRTGTSCAVRVNSASAARITYVAYVEAINQGGARLPSDAITVIWSAAPPPMPTSVYLTSKPAPTAGTVHVVIGTAVSLTATVDSPVDNTGTYIQLHNDTTGAQVGNNCVSGLSCGATVRSTVPTTDVFKAYIVKASSNAIIKVSSPITVAWSPPQPPTSISLSASNTNPIQGQTVTLTATTNGPVDSSGYEIQIVGGGPGIVATCTSGSTCSANPVSSGPVTVTYTAYVDQGYPNGVVATSNSISVTWSPPPPPNWVQLWSSPPPGAPQCSNPAPQVGVDNSTWVNLIVTANSPVDNTGYEFMIVGIPQYGGNVLQVTQATGSSWTWPVLEPGTEYEFFAFVTKDPSVQPLLESCPIMVQWSTAPGVMPRSSGARDLQYAAVPAATQWQGVADTRRARL